MKCGIGETEVREHVRKSYQKKSGEAVSKSIVTEHCREIFKKSKEWLSSLKDGAPLNWPLKREKFGKWTISERKILEERLSLLPDFVLDRNPSGIYRGFLSRNLENPAISNNETKAIIIYDPFFSEIELLQQKIISHEVGHFIFRELTTEQISEFRKLSGWSVERNQVYKLVPPIQVIAEDSRDSIDEDFANNLEFYSLDEEGLKKFNPKMLNFFKNNFPKAHKEIR